MKIARCFACLILLSQISFAKEAPFYLTLDTPPAPELSPTKALGSFSIAPGFKIELVASEPLVVDPVAITWDELGDLYVVEMRGFMPDAYGNNDKAPVGEVVRLKDLDNDGRVDHREVLLNKLVLPRAIAIVNQGLLIAEPPNLWLCPNNNGSSAEISCKNKVKVADYGDEPGNVEHVENGLLGAIDNWLYNAKSRRRMRFEGEDLFIEPTLFRGQWGLTQDNQGLLYYNTNSIFLLGDLYDAQPIINAGNLVAPGLNVPVSKNDQVFSVRVNPGVNRAYVPGVLREDGRLNKPTSASGMAYYRGGLFPASHNHDVFVAEPAGNVVVQLRLEHDQLAVNSEHILYEDQHWGQREFLASTDERFRPVDVDVGPDGALYITDMYRGIIQDQIFLSDELRSQALARGLDKPVGMGRIWRISAIDGPETSRLGSFPASSSKLLNYLKSVNGWERDTAQRLLIDKKSRFVDSGLRKLVRQDNEYAALHAIWTLEGRGKLKPEIVRQALAHHSRSVKLAGLRAGNKLLTFDELLDLAENESQPELAHHATMYLAEHNRQEKVLKYLATKLLDDGIDKLGLIAIRAASNGNEFALVETMMANSWNENKEKSTGFIGSLTTQAFRARPDQGGRILDFIVKVDEQWLQKVVMAGVFEVTRDEGYSRVVLNEPHGLFNARSDELWTSVAKVRKAFTWQGDDLAEDAKPLSPVQQDQMRLGADYYLNRCAICHGADGKGITSLAPTLVESVWVTGPSEILARIVLQGLQGPIEVQGETWNAMMPGHASVPDFDDETAAGLLTYLHRAWGHAGRAIDPKFIARTRVEISDHRGLWTVKEFEDLEINTHYRKYVGRYGGGAFSLNFEFDGRDLIVQSIYFNGPMVEQKEDHFFFEPREFSVEFVWDENNEISAVRVPLQGGVELPRVRD